MKRKLCCQVTPLRQYLVFYWPQVFQHRSRDTDGEGTVVNFVQLWLRFKRKEEGWAEGYLWCKWRCKRNARKRKKPDVHGECCRKSKQNSQSPLRIEPGTSISASEHYLLRKLLVNLFVVAPDCAYSSLLLLQTARLSFYIIYEFSCSAVTTRPWFFRLKILDVNSSLCQRT